MKIIFTSIQLLIAWQAFGQNDPWQMIRSQTEKKLAAIVQDASGITGMTAVSLLTGERFDINAHLIFAQASAIKIPILMEVYGQAHQGKFKLTDQVWVRQPQLIGGSGILNQLPDSLQLSIRNLCTLMITMSDNTATNILIDLVGLSTINQTIQRLGLKQTKVQRKMIQPEASARGDENISTPAEAARLMEMLYKGEFINAAMCNEILAILQKVDRSESRTGAELPKETGMAYKPGGLSGVSTEWAIVYLKEHPYVLTMMENYKTETLPDHTMEQLSKVVYDYFWRRGNASPYGTYVDPALLKKQQPK